MRNLLFVCSRNQWRSPTAESIWRKDPTVNVRSAGTSQKAKRSIQSADIDWANIIFVMEDKHKRQLKSNFGDQLQHTPIHVLHIPDEYQYMDPALITELESSVSPILEDEGL